MRKSYFLLLFQLFITHSAYCNFVDTTTAKTVATNFFMTRVSQSNQTHAKSIADKELQFELVHQEVDDSSALGSTPYYYVYNVRGNNGFVIVSADDNITPVLGYAFEGNYDATDLPPAYTDWMMRYKRQIRSIKANKRAVSKVRNEWSRNTSARAIQDATTLSEVAPLLTTTWYQTCYYNYFCPVDAAGFCGHALTGCAATAMGQVMNYWKYPNTCTDIPGYFSQSYGWIEGIEPTTYKWSDMADNLDSTSTTRQIEAVAELIYHCGVAVHMDYSAMSSGAYSDYATKAFGQYFKYSSAILVNKSAYTDTEWDDLLKNELSNNRPILYDGYSISGGFGHSFVCDGYQDSAYFHFNFGWGGKLDGYFYSDNLAPGVTFLGDNQEATIGISPVSIPFIACNGDGLKDGLAGGTNGNCNGIAENGETIVVPFTLSNKGEGDANNVTASLSCVDSDITISTDSKSLGIIHADSTLSTDFLFSISAGCPDKVVTLQLKVSADEGVWTKEFKVHVYTKTTTEVLVEGTLNRLFTASKRDSLTYLAISGKIDARDFKSIRDSFPMLSVLDMSGATIVAYTGTEGTLSADSNTVYPANAIPANAFYFATSDSGKLSLNLITIPSSVTLIGDNAFNSCEKIVSMTIPASVDSIGKGAFSSCYGVTEYKVSEENMNYSSAEGVLFNKDKTTLLLCPMQKTGNYIVPDCVTSISYQAFYKCKLLTSVVLGKAVTSIGDYAFYYCMRLTSMTIPNSVTSIGTQSFAYCMGITSFTMGSGVTSIGNNAFYYCKRLTSMTIPNSVTSIGKYAFYRCMEMTFISIGSGLSSMGDYMFMGCRSLREFDVSEENHVYSSIEGVLFSKDKGTLIKYPNAKSLVYYVPENTDSIGDDAFLDCPSITSIHIPNGVTSIGESAFCFCYGLTSLSIPPSVTSIGAWAFQDCVALTEIVVSEENNNYCSMDGVLFNKDSSILLLCPIKKSETYIIPARVDSIGEGAFYNCSGLTSVTIPSGVRSIGEYAFGRCVGLISIYSESAIPPLAYSDALESVDTAKCILYVPIGSSSAYATADQWSNFSRIVEVDITSVPEIETRGTNTAIYTVGGEIIIEGVEAGTEIAVYTESGVLVQILNVTDSVTRIKVPAGQTYLINIGGKSMKIRI